MKKRGCEKGTGRIAWQQAFERKRIPYSGRKGTSSADDMILSADERPVVRGRTDRCADEAIFCVGELTR